MGNILGIEQPINLANDYFLRNSAKKLFSTYNTPCSTFLGIEVEVENVFKTSRIERVSENSYLWNNTEDGSLRNNGREFVSIPIKSENYRMALTKLYTTFKKDKHCIGYEFTDRTSVHVHVNALDMTPEQIKVFILAYLYMEPILYNYVGDGRRTNIFCVPIKESGFFSALPSILQHLADKGDISYFIGRWRKYTGFNLLPLSSRGTIEFRHMKGTDNLEYLFGWIDAILYLKRYAMAVKLSDFQDNICSVNTTSEFVALAESIIPSKILLSDYPRYQPDFEERSIFIKGVLKNLQIQKLYIKSEENSFINNVCSNKYSNVIIKKLSTDGLIQKYASSTTKKSELKKGASIEETLEFLAEVVTPPPAPTVNGTRPTFTNMAATTRLWTNAGNNAEANRPQVVVADEVDF